ncbi:MAG: hypothetical protein LUG93_01105, partial [Lachnospiraceae bacterium]|nr:hypothetical protein [Lachnospiraceae bacterium]
LLVVAFKKVFPGRGVTCNPARFLAAVSDCRIFVLSLCDTIPRELYVPEGMRMICIQMVDEEPDAREFLHQFQKFFEPSMEAPFRDPESAGYFREVLGAELGDDWYSVPEPKVDMSDSETDESEAETSGPDLEAYEPAPEASLSDSETDEPAPEAEVVAPETDEPAPQADIPDSETDEPDSETCVPDLETNVPASETNMSDPKEDVPEPGGEGGRARLAFGDLLYVHKIALLLIGSSREGSYTPFQLARRLEKRAWLYLASLPFDILICMRRYSDGVELLRGVDYLVSGYRYRGREIEVSVTDRITLGRKDDFFTKLEPHIKFGAGYGLCMGKDGRYYMGTWEFGSAVRYYWLNDIPDTIAHLAAGRRNRERGSLMGEPVEYSLLDYAKLALQNPFHLSRTDSMTLMPGSEKERKWMHSVLFSEFGMKESEFPDITEFKVVNHMYSYPDPVSRTLPVFLADQHADGSWSLSQEVTYKNPEFDEILAQVVCSLRNQALERYILVVDRNIELDGPDGFEDALCGFLLKQNSLEVFGRDMALNRFEEALREAFASGKYEVRNKWET